MGVFQYVGVGLAITLVLVLVLLKYFTLSTSWCESIVRKLDLEIDSRGTSYSEMRDEENPWVNYYYVVKRAIFQFISTLVVIVIGVLLVGMAIYELVRRGM